MRLVMSVCLVVMYPVAPVCLRVCSNALGHVYSSNAFGLCLSVCTDVSVVDTPSNIFQ